jgi:hypothetical protein
MVGEDFKGDINLMKGKLKLIIEKDEYYVVGEGLLLPVKSYQEGVDLLNEIEEKK